MTPPQPIARERRSPHSHRGDRVVAITLALAVALGIATWAPAPAAAQSGDAREPSTATAEGRRQAKEHFARAERLFSLGRFAKALVEYETAYELAPFPALLFNIGQCYRNLGKLDRAIFSFKKYLALKPDARDRTAVSETIRQLEAERAKRAAQRRDLTPPTHVGDGAGASADGAGDPLAARLSAQPPAAATPWYRRGWVWGAVAGVAAATAATLYLSQSDGLPVGDLGMLDYRTP